MTTLNYVKLLAITMFVAAVAASAAFRAAPVTVNAAEVVDTAATYKAKCAMCHKPTAEKSYDPAKTEDEHIEIVLKGKKAEKPPNMPGFEAKGMTRDDAKALVEYMQ